MVNPAEDARCAAPSRWPPSASARPAPTRSSAASSSTRRRVVGEGSTRSAGGPHAEVGALAQAGDRARGGTAVVTLEPCNHTGRTGPCSQALIAAGVARVVVARARPATRSPPAAPRRCGPPGSRSRSGYAAARRRRQHGLRSLADRGRAGDRPYVIWKYAATLDGRSAAADGTSQWITSREARADVHGLRGHGGRDHRRGRHRARRRPPADRPRPTPAPGHRQPLRVVVDSAGRTPDDARVRDGAARTWIATAAEVGAGPDGRVDLRQARRRAVRARLPRRAAGGRPDAGRRVPARRPGRRGGRLRRAEAARRRPGGAGRRRRS